MTRPAALRVYERYGGGPQVLGADVKALLQEKTLLILRVPQPM